MEVFFTVLFYAALVLGCTRSPEIPRQEQMEKEKHEDLRHLDREMEKEQDRREVKSQAPATTDP